MLGGRNNPPLEGGSKNPKDFSGRGRRKTPPRNLLRSARKLSTLPQGEGRKNAMSEREPPLEYLKRLGEAGEGPHDIAMAALMLSGLDHPTVPLEPPRAH